MDFSTIRRDEVLALYEQAGNKRAQKRILCDFLGCSAKELDSLLIDLQIERDKHLAVDPVAQQINERKRNRKMAKQEMKKRNEEKRGLPDEVKKRISELLTLNWTAKEIALELSLDIQKVYDYISWERKKKKRLQGAAAELASEAAKISSESAGSVPDENACASTESASTNEADDASPDYATLYKKEKEKREYYEKIACLIASDFEASKGENKALLEKQEELRKIVKASLGLINLLEAGF